MTSWSWVAVGRAKREIKKLDQPTWRRITDALDRFAENYPNGDVKKLQGMDDEYRLRVGDWRVLFRRDVNAKVIVVFRVSPRGDAYKG